VTPFPIVVGCGRSGTTLVRAMLNAHPAFAVPDESYFPAWLGRERARYERPEGFATDRFIGDLLAHESFGRWGLDADTVRAELQAAAPATFADGVRAYFACYAAAHGKPRYADKTPIFVLHIPLLAALFPEAVFVHMVRDGRDCVASRVETAWGTSEFSFETLEWKRHIERGRTDGAQLGSARYREFHYEDVVADPEHFARDLCRFAGADFEPEMLRYHESSAPLVDAMVHPDEHRNLLRPPTRTRDWRKELEPEQIALFDALAGPTLAAFGYERAPTPANAEMQARALVARARYTSTVGYRRARSVAWRALHGAKARS
jgi:hypothetical protein